jgi:signal transduction histidine kinase
MTGGGDSASRLKGLQLGANEFLHKPLDRSELIARVRTLLSMRWAHSDLSHQIQESERLTQLNELLVQTIAHDVRAPLSTAKGFLEIGLDQLPAGGGPARDHLTETLFSIVAAIDLTEDVDDISRLEAGEITPRIEGVNIEEAASALIKAYDDITETRHISMVVHSEGTELEAAADRKLLARTLRNLFTFALAHTANHGKVDVFIRPGEKPELLSVTFQYEAEHIPQLARGKLFDALTQIELRRLGHLKNAGLGLTFCRTALGAMGGTISVESDQVEGTRFTFTLPRTKPKKPA